MLAQVCSPTRRSMGRREEDRIFFALRKGQIVTPENYSGLDIAGHGE